MPCKAANCLLFPAIRPLNIFNGIPAAWISFASPAILSEPIPPTRLNSWNDPRPSSNTPVVYAAAFPIVSIAAPANLPATPSCGIAEITSARDPDIAVIIPLIDDIAVCPLPNDPANDAVDDAIALAPRIASLLKAPILRLALLTLLDNAARSARNNAASWVGNVDANWFRRRVICAI